MDNTKIAFAEVYDIIMHSNKKIQEKIPYKFIKILQSYKDDKYVVSFDYNTPLEKQNMQYETKVILGIIYRDYLCTPEKRQQLIKNENELLQRIEKEKNEKYSVDNLFLNRNSNNMNMGGAEVNTETGTQIIKYEKEKWYKKVFNFIKRFLDKFQVPPKNKL